MPASQWSVTGEWCSELDLATSIEFSANGYEGGPWLTQPLLERSHRITVKELSYYLNDHLAGSVGAVELLDHLVEQHEGKPLGQFFVELQRDIKADQKVLRTLIQRFNAKPSAVGKIGAWFGEKFGWARTRMAGDKQGEVGLLHALEVLVLGVTGKQLLWRALAASLGNSPLLKGVDLSKLEERAIEQIERVEGKRLEAAREAFLR